MSGKIGFIGAGNLAGALINGMLKSGKYKEKDIYIYDIIQEKRDYYKSRNINAESDECGVVRNCDIIFIAVKPVHLKTVLTKIKSCADESKVFVSVVAGVSVAFIREYLGTGAKVVRVMPNTPALIGEGATAISYDDKVGEMLGGEVADIFGSVGIYSIIPEDNMNGVISLNGSSPAYIYMLIKALIEGAEEQGIDEMSAKKLAIQSIIGCARMVSESDESIDTLIKRVCSPNGTTEKAVDSLNNNNFIGTVKKAMYACTERADSLELEIKQN